MPQSHAMPWPGLHSAGKLRGAGGSWGSIPGYCLQRDREVLPQAGHW